MNIIADKRYSKLRIVALITFIIMIATNALANIIPINGQTTGEVSDSIGNLFAPAGYTFSIWGLIYILLLVYSVYQLGIFDRSDAEADTKLLNTIAVFFSISSVVNTAWIFAWHYNIFWLSVVLIATLLVLLIVINEEIRKRDLSLKETILIKLPFSVYFGWVTVATIANITGFLVSIGWRGFGIEESIWTIIILIVGFLIASAVIVRDRNIAYALTVIWAYTGILVKHSSVTGFNGTYPSVISTVSICIAFLVIVSIYSLFRGRKKEKYS